MTLRPRAVSLSLTTNRCEAEGIRHDADVLLALILEQDCVNVLIDPGHEAYTQYPCYAEHITE